MALMYLTAQWRAGLETDPPDITILTVDHRLRPESSKEANWVATQAKALGLPHAILVWDDDKPKGNVQTAAREARYDLLVSYCHAHNISTLLTAHHLEDQAETLLMRLARGSGVDGLAAIPERTWWPGIELVRPLLDIPKSQIIATLEKAGITWLEDPSNQDDRFERVRLRQGKRALTEFGLTPDTLARTAKRLRRARNALDAMTDEFLKEVIELHKAGFCKLPLERLLGVSEEIAIRALGRVLQAIGGNVYVPRLAKLETLLADYHKGLSGTRTLAGCQLLVSDGHISVFRELRANFTTEIKLAPGEQALWDHRFQVSVSKEVSKPVCVRALTEKAYLELRKTFLGEIPIPPAARPSLVSFWQENKLLAVPHLGYNKDWDDVENIKTPKKTYFKAVFLNAAMLIHNSQK